MNKRILLSINAYPFVALASWKYCYHSFIAMVDPLLSRSYRHSISSSKYFIVTASNNLLLLQERNRKVWSLGLWSVSDWYLDFMNLYSYFFFLYSSRSMLSLLLYSYFFFLALTADPLTKSPPFRSLWSRFHCLLQQSILSSLSISMKRKVIIVL